MTYKLIFVCEANICRSPLMELVMRGAAAEGDWDIASAGTRVGAGGREMCRSAAAVAAAAGGDSTVAATSVHQSTPVKKDELVSADMILTASLAERASTAAHAPTTRSRTFTLREAVLLGSAPTSASEVVSLRESVPDYENSDGVLRYAALLHARRGFVAPRHAPWWELRRRARRPLDIADAHHSSARTHRSMLTETVADVQQFHAQLVSFLAEASTDSAGEHGRSKA